MRHLIPSLVFAVTLGCVAQAPPPRTAEAAVKGPEATPPTTTASQRAPMTVEWVKSGEAAGRLTLVARVNRFAAIRVPTTVQVTVPAGVRVVSGRTSWVIEGSESVAPVEEVLVFEVLQAGAQEILLAADATGTGFGVHAKKAYPLGPPAPKTAAPVPGPDLEIGGRNFGPSVPARP
jgi:hypothetical protein